MPELAEARAAIIAAGQRLDRLGWVPAPAGNISVWLRDGTIAITRSGGHEGFLDAEGVIRVGLDGRPLRAARRFGLPPG